MNHPYYRKVSLRSILVLVAALSAVVSLTGCGVHGLRIAQSPLLKIFAARSGHIAYVGNDGNLYVADQSGSKTALTSDAGDRNGTHVTYVSPTWEPGGQRLAYARYTANPSTGSSTVQLDILNWKTKHLVDAFQSDHLKPFYFDWSPDGKHVAVLSDAGGGSLQLGIVTADRSGSYVKLDSGSPYYWTWTANGDSLVSHTDFTGTSGGRVSVIPLADPSNLVNLKESFGLFQAPAVLPNGDVVAVEQSNGKTQLAAINTKTQTTTRFAPAGTGGFLFSPSPNGKMMAYVEAERVNGKVSGVLHVWSFAENKDVGTVKENSTIGFYWSPDSSRIAYFTPALDTKKVNGAFAQIGSLPEVTLRVLDVSSGNTWPIATFPLTQGLLSTLPYTDQYQHSQTIWSPNSRYLLFTAYTNKGVPGIFVAGASGNVRPSVIAEGDSAVWSWK